VQQTFLGPMVQVATCPRCNGSGETIATPCPTCKGNGRIRAKAVLNVTVPAGVREGLQIQIRSEGDMGDRGAPQGNLYVVVHVTDHEFFKRKDNDIILDININVAQAALGDKLNIPTVDGDVELGIPAGTQTGKVFRCAVRGFRACAATARTPGVAINWFTCRLKSQPSSATSSASCSRSWQRRWAAKFNRSATAKASSTA